MNKEEYPSLKLCRELTEHGIQLYSDCSWCESFHQGLFRPVIMRSNKLKEKDVYRMIYVSYPAPSVKEFIEQMPYRITLGNEKYYLRIETYEDGSVQVGYIASIADCDGDIYEKPFKVMKHHEGLPSALAALCIMLGPEAFSNQNHDKE